MKKLILMVLVCSLLAAVSFARSVSVRGSIRSSGQYVAPHYKTFPNTTKADNYSTKGNVNPYSGKRGTKWAY